MRSPAVPANRFADALTYLTPDDDTFFFNDWAAIKESLGASDVTSASPESDRRRVLVEGLHARQPRPGESLPPQSPVETVVDGYGLQDALVHAQTWKFDVLDYEWEAMLGGPPSTHVIRFRQGFDLAPVISLFDERGYTSERVGIGTLRMHEHAPVDWMLSDFAIFNVGFLDDGRTMVLSNDPDGLRTLLTADLHALPAHITALQAQLGEPWALGMVLDGAGWCAEMASDRDAPADLVELAGPLGVWDALVVAYSRATPPIGTIAFAYEDESMAESDLAGRRLLAQDGVSLVGEVPPASPVRYADVMFTVDDARAAGGVLRLDVSPVGDQPGRLFAGLYVRDMLYAICSG